MWNLIRIVVATLALVGFVGQTTARAMPMTAMAEAAAPADHAAMARVDCADMPGMTSPSEQASKPTPCEGVTVDCIGKMGCATVPPPVPAPTSVPHSVAYEGVRFILTDLTREGVLAPLLYHPPKPLV